MIIEKKDLAHSTVRRERKASWLVCRNHGIEGVKPNSSGVDKLVAGDGRPGRG